MEEGEEDEEEEDWEEEKGGRGGRLIWKCFPELTNTNHLMMVVMTRMVRVWFVISEMLSAYV